MSGPEFFQTHMGQRFFQSTMPSLVQQLEKLNEQLERQVHPEIAARWKQALEKIAEDKVAWNLVTIARNALDGERLPGGSGVYVSQAQWEAYEVGRARGRADALEEAAKEIAELKAQVEKERKSR